MLEGKNVDLKLVEKEEIPQLLELQNRPDVWGQYESPRQTTKAQTEKNYDEGTVKCFFIQRKDGTRVGVINCRALVPDASSESGLELGYLVLPSERGKGYCTEAVNLVLDYCFLTLPIVRVQAHTDVRNKASLRVLEKTGFTKEGTIRKGHFARGEHTNGFILSILRDEWGEPRILKAPP